MLIAHAIQGGQAGYYLRGPGPGRWVGSGGQALGLAGDVDEGTLGVVLAGRDPRPDSGGRPLLRRIPPRRRAGFDLVLAAPKSVSILAGLAGAADGDRLVRAHEHAVVDVLGFLERWATWTRRGAEGRRIPATGLLAAAFTHHSSSAGDPHLHTHAVVANLVQGSDGVWSCLDSRAIYRHARAAGAIYQASLRHHLAVEGFGFTWQLRPDGRADVIAVPRPAIESCSQRSRQIREELERRGLDGSRASRAAAGRTRRQPLPDVEPWRLRSAAAGFDEPAARVLLAGRPRRVGDDQIIDQAGPHTGAIERVLIERGSWFTRSDTARAIASLLPLGAPAAAIERWTDDFLDHALARGHDRWSTPRLLWLEAQAVQAASSRCGPAGLAGADAIEAVLARRPELDATAKAAVGHLTSGRLVDIVASTNFINTAALLDAARAAWEASGHRVAVQVATTSQPNGSRAMARWQALAGLEPAPSTPGGHRPTVLIVDQADRATTAELHRIVTDAAARGAKVVLIDGGTRPARREPESPAFSALRNEIEPVTPGGVVGRAAAAEVVRAGRDESVVLAPSPISAAAALIADWHRARAGTGRPVMVAIGAQEAEYLNATARVSRRAAGELVGPVVRAGDREFQLGDEVRALRRDVRLGEVAAGRTGLITAVDPDRRLVTIRWPTTTVTLPASDLVRAPISHAYAITPAYGRSHAGPVLALGDLSTLAPTLQPAAVYGVAPDRLPPARSPGLAPIADLASELHLAPVPSAGAHRPLAELIAERDAITRPLLASASRDPRPELRQLAEDRPWIEARRDQADRADRLADLDRRSARLIQQRVDRAEWIEHHSDALATWTGLNEAIAWREAALGRAAELRPSRCVAAALGPIPSDDGAGRQAWRDAARAIECHRERWGLPDEALLVGTGRQLERHRDELLVLAACRAADRARSIGQERGLAVAGH